MWLVACQQKVYSLSEYRSVEIVILSKVREGEISYDITYVESKKNWYKLTYLKNTDSQTLRTNLWLPERRMREGIVREFGLHMYTLLYLKWMTNKDLLVWHMELCSMLWQAGCKGSLGENGYMCIRGWIPLLFTWNYPNIINQTFVVVWPLSHVCLL